MQISGASGAAYNSIELNPNNSSNSTLNALRKEKMQIQDQIKKTQESKLPTEIKQEKIKALQQKISEIENQIIVEQTKKLSEDMAAKNDKQTEKMRVKDEKTQGLTQIEMTGIISASSHLEIGETAFSVYAKASTKGDSSTMKRALSYAMPEIEEASQDLNKTAQAIQEYKEQASRSGEADNTASDEEENMVGQTVNANEAAAVSAKDESEKQKETVGNQVVDQQKSEQIDLKA